MTTGILHSDLMQTSPPSGGPRFRPFASTVHKVTKGRYITSNDPRGYIPVYEYPLNGQWIMMDTDDGYILWTGIWKALGNSKADIVKMIDSQPDLASVIRRVRGGYLKIQGTWMPYEVALRLSRRVAWSIREDLIPLFGPTFPSTCLSPDQPGYGQVVAANSGRRRRRAAAGTTSTSTNTNASRHARRQNSVGPTATSQAAINIGGHEQVVDWNVASSTMPADRYSEDLTTPSASATTFGRHATSLGGPGSSAAPRYPPPRYSYPYASHPELPQSPSTAPRDYDHHHQYHHRPRYAPYPGSVERSGATSDFRRASLPDLTHRRSNDRLYDSDNGVLPPPPPHADNNDDHSLITLAPLRIPPLASGHPHQSSPTSFALPPISSLDELRNGARCSAGDVLQRLKALDDDSYTSDLRHSSRDYHHREPSPTSAWRSSSRPQSPPFSYSGSNRAVPLPRRDDFFRRQSSSSRSRSDDGNSSYDASPISPATPQSSYSVPDSVASSLSSSAGYATGKPRSPALDILEPGSLHPAYHHHHGSPRWTAH